MILVEQKPNTSKNSPLNLSAQKDEKATLNFSQLLKGASHKDSPELKQVQNGALVVALTDSKDTQLTQSKDKKDFSSLLMNSTQTPQKEVQKKVDIKNIPILDKVEINPQATADMSPKEIKLLIANAKKYLKDKILQSDDYKIAQTKELPKTIKGLVQVAQKLGIDVSKISVEEIKADAKNSVKTEILDPLKKIESTKAEVKPEVKLEAKPEVKPEAKGEIKTEIKAEIKTEQKNHLADSLKKVDAPKTEVKPDVKAEVKPEIKSEIKPEIKSDVKAEVKPEIKSDTKPDVKADAKPEIKSEIKPEIKSDVKAEVKPEIKSEVKTEVKAEVKTEVKPEVKTETKSDAKPEVKADVKPDIKHDVKPEPRAETKPEVATKPTPLFKAQNEAKITTQQTLQAREFRVQEPSNKSAKERADDTLKRLISGERATKLDGPSKLMPEFSVATARVLAPTATTDAQRSLESLLRSDSSEQNTSSKVDGFTAAKADSFEVKVSEAKQMNKYLSQDVKQAIDNYKAPFTRIKVQINPEKLGEVDLTVVQRGKNLHVNISSNNIAINALAMNANDLRAQLTNNGIQNATLNFNSSSSDGSQGNQQQQNQRQNHQAREEYNYYDNEEHSEEALSSLEIVVPNYV